MRTFSSPGVLAADERSMALLATCFVLFLAPQEPAPTAPPTVSPPTTAPATPPAEPDAASRLLALEKAGPKADVQALVELANGDAAAIAARAAWALGVEASKFPVAALIRVVTDSPHAEARAQAMQALERRRDAAATPAAIQALHDADRRVRTFAATLLGKLRAPTAVEPLLTLIDGCRKAPQEGAASDLQAALLALHDLGAAPHLLRVAMALHDGKVEGIGETLAYCCQELSPKLPTNEQTTFLVAMLDHREPLVRRYAIARLGELGEATTAAALEAHLSKESKELRPLVEVALAQVRKDKSAPPPDEISRAKGNLSALWHQASTWWGNQDVTMQALTAAGPILALVLMVALWRLWRRRSDDRAAAAATVAMVQPSAEFVAQTAAAAEELAAEAELANVKDVDANANAAEPEHDVASHR